MQFTGGSPVSVEPRAIGKLSVCMAFDKPGFTLERHPSNVQAIALKAQGNRLKVTERFW
jgi:hypothetical protein